MIAQPINIQKWIEENADLLKPPVNNYCLHKGGATVMIVGGPNERTDYHINQTPEYFYQLKGKICIKVVDEGEFRDIIIDEGESFLLPPNIPHNPVRYANTIGLVVEQDRPKGVEDKLRWYCLKCKKINHEVQFYCFDLGTQIKDTINNYDNDISTRTCDNCGTINFSKPQAK